MDKHAFAVDCEYDTPTQQLISMAIVPLWPNAVSNIERARGLHHVEHQEFYAQLRPTQPYADPWVRQNVVLDPNMTGQTRAEFQRKLEEFLLAQQVQTLWFDWPDDVVYFNRMLILSPGRRIRLPVDCLNLKLNLGVDAKSTVAHHALHDARAIAKAIRYLNYRQYCH